MPKRSFSQSELKNSQLLSSKNLNFGVFFVTDTGLSKNLLDATADIKKVLALSGIHDYEGQGAGPDHKVQIPAVIGLRKNETNGSFYRPKTKRGKFARMWFGNLDKYCNPDDAMALVALPSADDLGYTRYTPWIVNLTREDNDQISGVEPFLTRQIEIVEASVVKIGEHRGAPRLWIEGAKLSKAGFSWGDKYNIDQTSDELVITLSPDGSHAIAGRNRAGKEDPIIDFHDRSWDQLFPSGKARVRFFQDQIRVSDNKGSKTVAPASDSTDKAGQSQADASISNLPDISEQLKHLLGGGFGLRGKPDEWLKVPTKLDDELSAEILKEPPTLVVLSGNAGDGKTAFIETLLSSPSVNEVVNPGQNVYDNVRIGQGDYMVIMDGSETPDGSDQDQILLEGFRPFEGEQLISNPGRGLMIAVNKGRLLEFLERNKAKFKYLNEITEALFVDATRVESPPYKFVDLNNRSLLMSDLDGSFFGKVIKRIEQWDGWNECGDCPAIDSCVIRHNLDMVTGQEGAGNLWKLFDAIDLDDKEHLTARSIVSTLVGLVLSNNDCDEIRQHVSNESYDDLDRYKHAYNNLFAGHEYSTSLSNSLAAVVKNLDPSQANSPDNDRFVGDLAAQKHQQISQLNLHPSEIVLRTDIDSVANKEPKESAPILSRIDTDLVRRSFLGLGDYGAIESEVPLRSVEYFRQAIESKGQSLKWQDQIIRGLNGLVGAPIDSTDLLVPRSSTHALTGTVFATSIPQASLRVISGDSNARPWVEYRARNLMLEVLYESDRYKLLLPISLSLFDVLVQSAVGRLPYGQLGRDVIERIRGGYKVLSGTTIYKQSLVILRDGQVVHRMRGNKNLHMENAQVIS